MWRMAPRLMVLAAVFCPGTAYGDQPFFMGLGDLPGGESRSQATAVSSDGKVIVGFSSTTTGLEAFRWTAETGIVGLGDLPGGQFGSFASGVSADGAVIVGYSHSTSGDQAFRWTASVGMVGLGDLPGGSFDSSAQAVSGNGSIVVGYASGSGGGGFRWTAEGGMVGLGVSGGGATGISADGNTIVGHRSPGAPAAVGAFRWQNGAITDLGDFPGGEFHSVATAASADGEVIVGYGASEEGAEAFRWTQTEGMLGLGELPGGQFYSAAHSVSADGLLIAGSSRTDASPHSEEAFVWNEPHGMRRLIDVLTTGYGLDLVGWTLTSARVSADGLTFVGWGFNPEGHIEAFAARVPEPSSLALLAFAGSGLTLWRCRRSDRRRVLLAVRPDENG